MFERKQFGWFLGRPSLSGGTVGWTGVVMLPDFSASVNTVAKLDAILSQREIDGISALGCTSSENLIAALEPSIARKIAPKIIDFSLAMRVASPRGDTQKSTRRTIDLLAECISNELKMYAPELAIRLLEGRDEGTITFEEVDSILRSLLHRLAQRLRAARELRRYMGYELPAHRVLLAQSSLPLLAACDEVAAIADDLSSKQRSSRVELVTKHGLDPADFIASFEARRTFAELHLGVSRDRLTLGEFRELLEERPRSDKAPDLVASFLKDDSSRRSMLTLTTTSGCQVVYDSIGTSTGRIVMRSPEVQWLEKKYRKHILPPDGHELRYLDYSCFEPTILAAVSGDTELLAACASGIYESVAEWLGFDGTSSRDLAKAILLRFIYGQAQDKLVATLSTATRLEPEDARSRLEDLRRRLAKAFDFRSELAARARATGYMETRIGNRCPIEEGGEYKALSHYLQGTGALIFKRALIDIFGDVGVARLVVPMHDAFLCAFPTESLEYCSRQAVAAMRNAFFLIVGVDLARVTVRGEF